MRLAHLQTMRKYFCLDFFSIVACELFLLDFRIAERSALFIDEIMAVEGDKPSGISFGQWRH